MTKYLRHFISLFLLTIMICPGVSQSRADDSLDPLFDLGEDASLEQVQSPFSSSLVFDEKKSELTLFVKVKQGAYVYRDSLVSNSKNASITLLSAPEGKAHKGPDGKERMVIDTDFEARYAISGIGRDALARLSFQGCDAAGICYPPEEKTMRIPYSETGSQDQSAASENVKALESQMRSESTQSSISSLPLTLIIMLITGMGLDLTPCVLPLLGVFSAMIMGSGRRSVKSAVILNLSYLTGLVATYTVLGWIFANAGMQARALFSSPAVVISMAALFLVFAADCAEFISIKIPALFNARIQKTLSSGRRGCMWSSLVFGALSGLLTTPCTSAPLAAALLYVAKDGDVLRGTLMFMAVGLGMGLPLVIAGIFGARVLPKPGPYSTYVKKLIALPLCFAALLMVLPLTGWNRYFEALGGALMMLYFAYVTMDALHVQQRSHRILVSALYALCTLFTVYTASAPEGDLDFIKVSSVSELDALAKGSPLFVTFGASWCENCHAMDEDVYSKDEFTRFLSEKGIKGVRIDLSDPKSEFSKEMARRFEIKGVPAAVVMDDGRISPLLSGYQRSARVYKFIEGHFKQP